MDIKVHFTVKGAEIKGTIVEAPEGTPGKICFILGYRPEHATTWRGPLPKNGQVWVCQVAKNTKPDSQLGAFLVRLVKETDKSRMAERISVAVAPWAPPKFVASVRSRGPYIAPEEYYDFYPEIPGAWEENFRVIMFERLLVYKAGEQVVTDRSLDLSGDSIAIKKPYRDTVNGIIPTDAEDGFWYWGGEAWELCHPVEIRITGLRYPSGQTRPAYCRMVGLQTASGHLARRYPEYFRPELFELREIKPGEETGLPVVETEIQKFEFGDSKTIDRWLEPDLTSGIAPEMELILEFVDEVAVRKTTSGIYLDLEGITLQIDSGEVPPERLLQRVPGRTYRLWRVEILGNERFRALFEKIARAPLAPGPKENKIYTESGGEYFIGFNFEKQARALHCPHGWAVSTESVRDEIAAMQQVWHTEPCPFGCPGEDGIAADLIEVSGSSVLHHHYGVPAGFNRIPAVRERMLSVDGQLHGYDHVANFGDVYLSHAGAAVEQGAYTVDASGLKFFPAPIKVVGFGNDLVVGNGRRVGFRNVPWFIQRYGHLFEIVRSFDRDVSEYKKAGKLEEILAIIK